MDYPKSAAEYLNEIRKYPGEIRSLLSARAECWAQITSISGIDPAKEFVSGGGMPAGLDAKVEKWEDYNEQLRQSYEDLAERKEEAEKLLMQIPDPDQRAAIREYYLTAHSELESIEVLQISRASLWERLRRGVAAYEKVYQRVIHNKM